MTDTNPKPDYYAIETHHFQAILHVMTRLYSEKKFRNGDEMRDHAQMLQGVIDNAIAIGADVK